MSIHTEQEPIKGLPFVEIEGDDTGHDLTVYTLSTCAFCKRALDFLARENVRHRYIHLDTLPVDRKKEVKKYLRERFEDIPVFPVFVVDDENCLSGFAEGVWRKQFRDSEAG